MLARVATPQHVVPTRESCPNPPRAEDRGHRLETNRVLRALAWPRIAPSIFQFREFDTTEPGKSLIRRFLQSRFGDRRQREREFEWSPLAPRASRCWRSWHRQELQAEEKDE